MLAAMERRASRGILPWMRRWMNTYTEGGFRKKAKVSEINNVAVGEKVVVHAWVRTLRRQATVGFVVVNDGTCASNLQCVVSPEAEGYEECVASGAAATGASVRVEGELVASPGPKQSKEVKVRRIHVLGSTDPSFPIQKNKVSEALLGKKAHLRPRTSEGAAVSRVRTAMVQGTHSFFKRERSKVVDTPVLTASDCEGAGQQFRIAGDKFFGRPVYLTVSAQLHLEAYACALSDVYSFGPVFRAEKSNTCRHLAEFVMLEAEFAYSDLDDDIAYAKSYIQYMLKYVLNNCREDMDFLNTWVDKGIIDRLTNIAENQFGLMNYTDAIDLLLKAKHKFEFPVKWGCDLQSEHERYITEVVYNGCPVVVKNYPKEIKPFYMRQNDDEKTVASMDILFPKIGELVGGGQREERLEYLENKMDELKLNLKIYSWYLDLRRYGTVSHSGFGLGFDRFVQFVTSSNNIKSVVPFPRTNGSIEF